MEDWGAYDAQREDGFRAIGRYVVAFSELVSEMRQQLAWYCAGDAYASERMLNVEIALGGAAAIDIANAFFGLARHAGSFTDAEEKIAARLAKEVQDAISTRNDVAHGDWQAGALQREADAPVEAVHRLVRILPHRKAGPFKSVILTVKDIDAMTDALLKLLTTVVEFGKLAFGLPLVTMDSKVRTGEFRVSDVFVLKGGKGQKNAEVLRSGPKAAEINVIPYV